MAIESPQPRLTEISDPRVLRAIAHPLRNRILDELGAGGPMRAADLAQRLGIPANQASFHLRQLAKYDLVEEAPEQARDRRDRVWKARHEGGTRVRLADLEGQPGGKAAVTVFRRQWMGQAHATIERAEQPAHHKDGLVSISHGGLRLTKSDAQTFATALNDLVEEWRVKGQGRKTARTYELLWVLQPAPEVQVGS
jgi:DNA-binding transcriptional ArsR family regulator